VGATLGRGGAQEAQPEAQPTPEAEAASSPRAVTVAVASFGTGLTFPSLEPLCVGGTPQTLAARLRLVYMLNVRDAAKTYETLTAQKFEAAKVPLDDVAAQRKACEAADAQFLIVGSYKDASGEGVKPETSVKIRLALFARETGKSEDIGTVEGTLKDLPRLHAELTAKTLDKFRASGVPVRTSEWLEATREDAASLDAYLIYAEGNVQLMQKKAPEAQQKYREAYQKSNGSFDAALTAYERAGRQRIEELEKAGGDVQAEIQKEDAELRSLTEQNKRTAEGTLAAREMWKANRLRKKSAEESKKSYNTAIALCQTFLTKGTTQALKWKAKLLAPSVPFSTDVRPTVVNGVVYAGSADGYVFAFDVQTGARRWRFRAGQACATTPTVVDGVVYVGCNDGAVYALDAASGQRKWKFETKAAVWSSPTVSQGVVFFGSNDRNLYAVDAATGQLKWQLPTQGGIVASPRVENGVVYVGSRDNRLYAVDAASGQVKWRFTITGDILTTVAIQSRDGHGVDGHGVVYFGANDAQAYALDAATGAIKWKTNLGGFAQGSPVVSDGVIYIGASNSLHALDAATGSVKWKVSAQTIPAPMVQGDVVYAALGDENVYALDAKNGRLRWRFPTESILFASPRPTESALVVASGQNLYALNPQVETFPLLEEDALFQLGIAYHETGEFAKARDALTQLTERRPLYSADAYHTLADCYQRLNHPHEEISARLKAFALQSAEPQSAANVLERLHQIAGLRWVFRTGGRAFWQSVVDNNVIYVGSNDRHVAAIDANTGQAKWKTNINAPAWFAPVVGESLVYVANSQGAIYALDKNSGAVRWRAPTTPGPLSGPPVIAGNQLFMGAAGGALFSLSAATGQRGWSAQIGAPISSPCAVGDTLFFTSQSGDLHAFDVRALDTRWKLNVGASIRTPVHEQGILYVASQRVYAIDLVAGKIRWQFAPEAAACSAPVVTPTLVCCGASNGYVYALDKTTGGVKWKFWLLSGGAPPSVNVADDVLYASTLGGQIYAFDLNSGAFQWKFQAAGRFFSAPTVAGGKLFAACEDRNVYAFDLAQISALRVQGKIWWRELWSDEVGQAILSADAAKTRRLMQRAVELAGDNFLAHFEIGWRACDAKAYDVARQQAATLAKLDAEHPDVPWLLARVEKDEKHFAEAEKHLGEVVRRTPRLLKAYVELETVMEAQGKKFVPAEVMPKDAALAASLADTYLQKEQFEKAIAEYKRAVEIDPQQAQSYNNIAWLYATCKDEKLRNPQEALRLALKAVELAPRAAPILDTLAEAYFVNKRYDDAIDAITQAISLDPNNPFYRAQLARFRKAKQGG
jgi:outer membrane protein assembly factor BamB